MDICNKKDRLYNPITKRCYKSCHQKHKVTHPVTKNVGNLVRTIKYGVWKTFVALKKL